MSHYAVGVFHRKDQTVDELLAPYSENLKVDPYVSMSRREAIEYARKHIKGYEGKTDEECWQFMADDAGEGMTDADGNILSTYNPRSKWDWWYEGGRWGGMLNSQGSTVDSGRFGDLSFPPDEEAYEEAYEEPGLVEKSLSLYDEEIVLEDRNYGEAAEESYHAVMPSFGVRGGNPRMEYLMRQEEDRNSMMQAADSYESAAVPEGYISTEEAAAAQRSMAMKMIFGGGLILCIFALMVLYRQRKKMEIS